MLLDTTILVELLSRPGTSPLIRRILDRVGDEVLFASAIQLGELADVARQSRKDADEVVRRATDIVQLVDVNADIAVEASRLKAQARRRQHARDFSLVDGVIIATARTLDQRVLTLDREFSGFDDAVVVPR